MAVSFVEPEKLRCAGCGASYEHLTLVKRRRARQGQRVICTEVYRCRLCQHQTGTVRAEAASDPHPAVTR